MMSHRGLVEGRRLLLVEDEFTLASELTAELVARGAEVVGPVANVDDALDLIENDRDIDAAVLDLNLQGEMAFPVADVLQERGIPFVFATGYDAASIPARHASAPVCEKPVSVDRIERALFG